MKAGATGAALTVRLAELLVTVPALLEATTRYCRPESARVTPCTLRTGLVTPRLDQAPPLRLVCQSNVGVGGATDGHNELPVLARGER